jgi:hypothetical protein
LYLNPKGIIERTIVQRIDYNVGTKFLELLGLDWSFRELKKKKRIVRDKEVTFKRVIWVAHSLGTVISHNVLSDLFVRATEILKRKENDSNYSKEQAEGAKLFRKTLKRFVTLGSPVDKIAYLFPERLGTPFQEIAENLNDPSIKSWKDLLLSGEDWEGRRKNAEDESKEQWWFNFYHVFDPVSGALDSKYLFGENPPVNCHIRWFRVPLWAHVDYWKDSKTLRFILGRTYGSLIWDKFYKPIPAFFLTMLAIFFQFFEAIVAICIIWFLFNFNQSMNFILDLYSSFKNIF